jgi:hypothetical protein
MRDYFVSMSLAALLVACGSSENSGGGGAGSGGKGQGGDASCEMEAPDACIACCGEVHAEGAKSYTTTIDACACNSGPCASSCTALCGGGAAEQGCADCVQAALQSGACSSEPCGSDADCQAYSACGVACTSNPASSSSSSASTGTGSDPLAQARHDCVNAINADRATLGLPPYAEWTAEETCTDGQAASDAASNTPHGAFGMCGESAQNECPGWPGPPDSSITQCLAMMWAEGPGTDFSTHGHYINMSSTQYTMVSCGFHSLPDGSYWAAQDFK